MRLVSQPNRRSLPVQGCLIRAHGDDRTGVVRQSREGARQPEVAVLYPASNTVVWIPFAECRSAFREGMEVLDMARGRPSVEPRIGTIIASRTVGGRDQHLVDFIESGQRWWAAFENLRFFRGVLNQFESGRIGGAGAAERFRLRNLAYALDHWHRNTGALSHLDIDPLPHQIHLVHHILRSGNLNWLIADDVGLGKTIETGMLISALKARGGARRILLVSPAGLVRQWKDEMHEKFALSDFLIYGEDFNANDSRDWKRYDHVIGSLDLLKGEKHLGRILEAEPWDLIVFDEAHRLSRAQWGMRLDASERYRLAARLRERTSSMVLLSATPHQGRQDKFQALLELLRPEWKSQIEMLAVNSWVLNRMVIRNHKADVTDAAGNFIFKGKQAHTIEIPTSAKEREFDAALRHYLERGYGAAGSGGNAKARAIGFVMTVYRKLAASSIAAIHSALSRRLERLRSEMPRQPVEADLSEDNPFQGEWEELSVTSAGEFFEGELALLERLLGLARVTLANDSKIRAFMDGMLDQVLAFGAREKVLVFTEYRATQDHVVSALRVRFGESAVSVIHGGMDGLERRAAIAGFEGHGQFLVSTEAGGEGINLQRKCHIMVNYDLPWNPMRLVQRVGRLYRYGQPRQVVVFNVKSPDTLDGRIVDMMYARIQQVVADMAPVGEEFRPGLEEEILGEVVDLLDVESLLEEAASAGVERTQRRIDEALRKAREAAELQRNLFENVARYDAKDAEGGFLLSTEHVRAFVLGMFLQLGVELVAQTHGGAVLTFRLPEEVHKALGMRGSQLKITFDRVHANERTGVTMVDFEARFFRLLMERAKGHRFDALTASLAGLDKSAVVTAVLRWQNDQGVRMREEYSAALVDAEGTVRVNPEAWRQWLLHPGMDLPKRHDGEDAKRFIAAALRCFDQRLGGVSNSDLHPDSRQLIGAGRSGQAGGVAEKV